MSLEPGITNYEWLVERDIHTEGGSTNKTTNSGSDTSTMKHGLVTIYDGADVQSGSVDHKHTQDADSNFDDRSFTDTLKVTNSGSDTHSGSVERKHIQSGDQNYDITETNGATEGKSITDETNTVKPGAHQITESKLNQGYSDNAIGFDKNNPQSIIYEDTDISGGAVKGQLPNPDWHYATDQQQTLTTHTITGDTPDKTDSYQTGDAVTNNNNTTTSSGSNSGTDKTNYQRNEVNTDTYNNDTVSKENTESHSGGNNTKLKYQRDETNTDTYNSLKNKHDNKVTNSGDDVTTSDFGKVTDVDGSNTSDDRGRTGMRSISSSLSQAVSFIEETSAWEWLQSRLEVCFIGVYDI